MMEAEQQQQQTLPSPFMSPIHQYGSSIILLTNPENELHKMELMFRSLRKDREGKVIDVGKPLMNDYGISSVLGTIQSIVNQVTVMSNLSKGEIPMLIDFLGDTLSRDLMVNRAAYGIKSFAARDKIFFTALSTSFITMKRAYEGDDKKFWKGSTQEIHTRVDGPNQGKGILSTINPWNKK